jgi:alkylated DNA repair dioxygenase AlkB
VGTAVQGSLLDLQLGADRPEEGGHQGLRALGSAAERIDLPAGAWVDLARGWVGAAGAAELFDTLRAVVPWRAERRPMYDRIVDVPRLVCFCAEGEALPDPRLESMRAVLDAHYDTGGNDPFVTAGLCHYRDGRDSVAWHGDTIGRGARQDTIVAIVSFGSARRLLLRPRGGGRSMRFDLAPGDLLVMGGSCQRTFEHCVPKTTSPVGARLSVQFRQRGVR